MSPGINWKKTFGYEVNKKVLIEDPRLWFINICLSSLIFIYICVILVWKQGGYAVQYHVAGSARIKLYEPSLNGCDMLQKTKLNTCTSTLPPKSYYPYCTDYAGPFKNQIQRKCTTLSADTIQRRLPGSISMTTRVTEYTIINACNQTLAYCAITNNVTRQSSYYVTGVEDYTLSIFHTASYAASPDPTAPKGFIGSSDVLPLGKLYVAQPDLCLNFPNTVDIDGKQTNKAPCYLLATKNPQHVSTANRDEYPLSAILAAAGANLNDWNPGQPESVYRDTGMAITLQIVYQNFKPWSGIGKPDFYYNPVFQPHTGYSYYDKSWTNYPQNSVLESRWGILVETEAVGVMYQFRFIQLLQTITGSLALLGAVGLIINNFFLRKFEKNIEEEVEVHDEAVEVFLRQVSAIIESRRSEDVYHQETNANEPSELATEASQDISSPDTMDKQEFEAGSQLSRINSRATTINSDMFI